MSGCWSLSTQCMKISEMTAQQTTKFGLNLHFWSRPKVASILQTEASECGLACLAMVAAHYGHRTDLGSLRKRFSVSLKGATLKTLISMAEALLLQARPLKVALEQLQNLTVPCILHWDMNHFVVLTAVDHRGLSINDPAVGSRRLSIEEVSKHFTGVALELTPTAKFSKMTEVIKFTFLGLMGRITGLKRGMLQLLLIGAALQVCTLVAPFYLQWVVDEAIAANDHSLVTVLGVGFLLLAVIQVAMSAVRKWATTTLATSLNFQWFGNTFSHLMRLPLPYFEKRHLGDIVSRFGSMVTIQRSLTSQFVDAIIDGSLVLCTLVVMALYSLQLTVLAVVVVGLYGALRLSVFHSMRNVTAEQIVHAAKQQTHFIESARGVQTIRLFNRSEERRIGWMNMLADQFNADLRISRLVISYETANSLLAAAERVIAIWLAALAVLDGRFSVGMLFAYLSYKEQFTQRTSSLIDKAFEFKMLRLHGERVADIVLTDPEDNTQGAEVDIDAISPTLELRDVSFRYADGEPEIIKSLNLVVEAGHCVAISGASGCGKTTLVKLMLGLIEPTSGEVLIGGHKLNSLGRANYRQLMGTVMQDDHLFAGSVAENISFFDTTLDQALVESCARQASIHAEIMCMPMGYNTLVGDIESGFSGGQKQRILLARALYKSPRMLCLDEATSHLDVANEHLVNAAIRQLNVTRILVAHRPETIAMAQRVVVLEDGRIVRDLAQPQPESPADSELISG